MSKDKGPLTQQQRLAMVNLLLESINRAMGDRLGLIVTQPTDEDFRRELALTLSAHVEALTEVDKHRIGFR